MALYFFVQFADNIITGGGFPSLPAKDGVMAGNYDVLNDKIVIAFEFAVGGYVFRFDDFLLVNFKILCLRFFLPFFLF